MGRSTMRSRGRTETLRCPFCHDRPPPGAWAECASCRAPHHVDCWREGEGCASCRAPRPRLARPRGGRWWPWALLAVVQTMVLGFALLTSETPAVEEEDGPFDVDAALIDIHLGAARDVVDDLRRLVVLERRRTEELRERKAQLERALDVAQEGREEAERAYRLGTLCRALEDDIADLRREDAFGRETIALYDRLIEDRLAERCEPQGPSWVRGEVIAADELPGRFVVSVGHEQRARVGRLIFVFRDGRLRALLRLDRVHARHAIARRVDVFRCKAGISARDVVVFQP
jgi:hypothetical protein